MALSDDQIREILVELTARPGHEKVRSQVYRLLVEGLDAPSPQVHFELALPEVHGRLDALLGRTVFEFKSDLRRERSEAETKLADYLGDREAHEHASFVGIVTDGSEFIAYELRRGALVQVSRFVPATEAPRSLLVWLDTAVAVTPDLPPDPEVVRQELGRESLVYEVARNRLAQLWETVAARPEARLKRQIWATLLARVYGAPVEEADLFLQHTYLTIVAKTLAARVLDVPLPSPGDLLSGKSFEDAGISGVGQADFFNWVLEAPGGADLVRRITLQASRFRLRDIEHDVLHALYESLIDPQQRHDLGEYYTPDWLAWRMCNRVIERPLEQRVLDPACGSGTFLFHAVRRFLSAAEASGMRTRDAVARSCEQIIGVDIHPVAVIIARVTFLLALGAERLKDRPALSIPVYLGDALQWNTRQFMVEREVVIEVPDGPLLRFPAGITRTPTAFAQVVRTMVAPSGSVTSADGFRAWLQREHPLSTQECDILVETYEALAGLQREQRNHIWGYVAQNLSRPIWLSSQEQRVDVVIGNPPWLSYRYMSSDMQNRFREECQRRSIWAGGRVATHQDLSAYFFARCVELYLKPDGTIGFVMPYAALTRAQFAGFIRGRFQTETRGRVSEVFAIAHFDEAWAFDERVQPLFPVPSCVLIARKKEPGPLPNVVAYSGTLPRRDATWDEADRALTHETTAWPQAPQLSGGSPYRAAFRQGATMVPRVLCLVQPAPIGILGGDASAPLVRSQRSNLEKRPWKDLEPLEGRVEEAFLRPLYLGESIAPYRLLEPALAVIPWDDGGNRLLDAAAAGTLGFPLLAGWMARAEYLWNTHGHGHMSFIEQLDYFGKLSSQMPIPPARLVFAASGTLPAAALLADPRAIVEHSLYWIGVGSEGEGRYLSAILNSDTARGNVEALQARGQWGARHFDKLMLELPLPPFDLANGLHRDLADTAAWAERVAAKVDLTAGVHFVRARQQIREALRADGVGARINALVTALLGAP